MKNFKQNNLKITFDGKTISWIGKSIFRDPSKNLEPYFDSIIPQIDKNGVAIRFDQLEYLNSSSIRSILKLIRKLHALNINTEIIYSNDSGWQSTAFKAFYTLRTMMKNLKITGV